MRKHLVISFVLLISSFYLTAQTDNYQDPIELVEQVSYINYLFTDINGTAKEVMYPATTINTIAQNGFNFDGSSIPGMTSITESDMLAKPHMDTFTIIPDSNSEQKVGRVICDVYRDEHTPYEGDPRYLLKQAIADAAAMGFSFFVGPELEFFVCNDNYDASLPLNPCDTDCYFSDTRDPFMRDFRTSLFTALLSQNIAVEKIHHEVAPGQHELTIKYDDPLTIADQLIIAKQTIRSVCKLHNYKVTFMPKPFFQKNGSGMHMHFSLWDQTHNCNAFYDKDDPAKLSTTAKHFIAGVLAHITELNAIFNPTINSYKRLVPGFEAPINICWGTKNRSAMIRIPYANGHPSAVRAEIRSPDPMTNPYLAFAVLLRAGLDGIKKQLPLAAPIEDNLYHLSSTQRAERGIKSVPHSLEHALSLLEMSPFAKEIVGEILLDEFVKNKQKEIAQYNTFITNWEIQTYFEG